ncbi:MAG: carboxypeptidase-like regulatory domain-containing protein, partial [Bacteroidota bacterium]|nr:carboxypeptidase-like regulatory domain-containing protein [Bacteroidota bacterium]
MRNWLKHIVLTLLMVGATIPAFAQGILAGRVLDAESGETLPGVNVIVVGTSRGAATDMDGRFEIPNLRAGEYSVRVSFIGFETKLFTEISIRDGETTQLDVELGVAVLSTEDEIVVIGEKPLVDVESSSSSTSISREQLELAPLRDVQQAVATQVGVVRDPTGLYIRGGRASETGFYVD